jgi:hypothetical protein
VPIAVVLNDPDGSESYQLFIQDDLPPGSRIFGDGGREVFPEDGLYTLSESDVEDLTLLPPPFYSTALSGLINITGEVVVTERDNGSTATSPPIFISIDVEGVANAPDSKRIGPVVGLEDQPYLIGPAIDLNGVLVDVSFREIREFCLRLSARRILTNLLAFLPPSSN